MSDHGSERRRIQRVSSAYDSSPYYQKIWRSDSPAFRLMSERKWHLIESVLRSERLDCRSARILDIGVGIGADGPRFRDLAVRPDLFVGLDVMDEYARKARQANDWMNTVTGEAGRLPFPDHVFDIVYQSTMLSSVLDARQRQLVFREVERVLAPGGAFISYDVRYRNPWNPHTRPLKSREVRLSFPRWEVKTWSLTAIPQLQRFVAAHSVTACRLLEAIPFLRSHLVIVARKP